MNVFPTKPGSGLGQAAFTLVEMLVVIAIISILMTAGSIGLSGMGGKGVTSGVATVESLFDEARTTAVGRNLRTCVLVAKKLDIGAASKNYSDELRRIILATEKVDANGQPEKDQTGQPVKNPTWVLSSRGVVLPDQTFFSSKFSKMNHSGGGGELNVVTLKDVKNAYKGDYYIYMFNPQGILVDPSDQAYKGGASFIIGSGARSPGRPADSEPPRVTSSGKRDFGGFVIWRSGRTSTFRSPDQMGLSGQIKDF